MKPARVLLTSAAACMLLGACGSDDTGETSADTDTATSRDVDASATSTCEGTPGDGLGTELTTVELKGLGDNLQLTFRTDSPVESGELVEYVVEAWDPEGQRGNRLVVEIDRLDRVSEYVVAYPDDEQTDVDAGAEISGTTVTATYPLDSLQNVGSSFKWSATLKIDADPVDSCPRVGGDPLDPNRVLYPAE